jgi:hypothetical protein
MRDWEIIADNLSKAGWSWGCSSEIDSHGRVLFTADVLAFVLPASAHQPGRMTGGGSIQCGDFGRVTHGFELHCIFPEGTPPIEPNNLEINWGGGNNFHLTTLTTAICTDSPVIQQPPSAPL